MLLESVFVGGSLLRPGRPTTPFDLFRGGLAARAADGMAGRGCVVALLYAPGEVVMRVKYTSITFRAIGFAIENAAARPCGSRAMPS